MKAISGFFAGVCLALAILILGSLWVFVGKGSLDIPLLMDGSRASGSAPSASIHVNPVGILLLGVVGAVVGLAFKGASEKETR